MAGAGGPQGFRLRRRFARLLGERPLAYLLHLRPLDRTHLKPLVAGAGAVLVVGAAQRAVGTEGFPLVWIAFLAAFTALYALLLRLLGFEAEDADLLRAVLRRRKESGAGV